MSTERKVDVNIGQIRKKINDFDGKIIKTVRGKGYLFEPPKMPIALQNSFLEEE
jgi:DNA-binding response OmpR family regulator